MSNTISQGQLRTTLSASQSTSLEATRVSTGKEKGNQSSTEDTITLRSESTLSLTYTGKMEMNAGDKAKYGMLQNLVASLLQKQGVNTKIAVGDSQIDIADITPEEAQELVSDDGYFGVEQTSERIFQFAVGIAGGDPSRIEAIKEGIDKGFSEAKKAMGDWLPDISYDTYDAVMTKLDDWVAQSQAAA